MTGDTIRLAPDQLDQLADLIAARLNLRGDLTTAARMIDAAELADALGVARSYVYAHATELGAVRLGGERGRLRFDLATARAAFVTTGNSEPARPTLRTRPRHRTSTAGSVLTARPRGSRKPTDRLAGH